MLGNAEKVKQKTDWLHSAKTPVRTEEIAAEPIAEQTQNKDDIDANRKTEITD